MHGLAYRLFRRHALGFRAPYTIEQNDALAEAEADQGHEGDERSRVQTDPAHGERDRAAGESERDLKEEQPGNQPAVELQRQNASHQDKRRDGGDAEPQRRAFEFGIEAAETDAV